MSESKQANLTDALIPVVSLITMLGFSVYLFGDESSSGPNQIVLTLGAAIAAIVAIKNGHDWADILDAIIAGISLLISIMKL
jgi:NhaC family Na+:H+ antiporter